MIYISSSSAVNSSSEFYISSVYAIGDEDSYVITQEENWIILPLPLSVSSLRKVIETQHFNNDTLLYSPLRKINGDDSALSFISFIQERLRKTEDNESFSKKLFSILCEMGEPA